MILLEISTESYGFSILIANWVIAIVAIIGLFYTFLKLRDYKNENTQRENELSELRTQALNQVGINDKLGELQKQNLEHLKEIQKQTGSLDRQVFELAKSNTLIRSQVGLQINSRKKDILPFFQHERIISAVMNNSCVLTLSNKGHRAHKLEILFSEEHNLDIQCTFKKKHLYVEEAEEISIKISEVGKTSLTDSLSILHKDIKIYLRFQNEDNNLYQQRIHGLISKLDIEAPEELF